MPPEENGLVEPELDLSNLFSEFNPDDDDDDDEDSSSDVVSCHRCSSRFVRDEGVSDNNFDYCASCYDMYLVTCEVCGTITNRWDEVNSQIRCMRCMGGAASPPRRNAPRVQVRRPSWGVPADGWGLEGHQPGSETVAPAITRDWRTDRNTWGETRERNANLNSYHSRVDARTDPYNLTRFGEALTAKDTELVGIELEVITHQHQYDTVIRKVVDSARTFSVFAESDGSLRECATGDGDMGVEFVTQPHHASLCFPDTYEWMEHLKYCTAWDERCCGLHININKGMLTGHAHLARLLSLMHGTVDNAAFWERMARRKSKQNLQTYAKIAGVSTKDILNVAQEKIRDRGKYHALRIEKATCIEFRIFQATLSPNSLCGAAWLALAAVYYSRDYSWKAMHHAQFNSWMTTVATDHLYPEPWINAGIALAAEYAAGAKIRY